MRALLLKGKELLEVEEVPDPVPSPGEALVEVVRGGICGSDMEKYDGGRKMELPRILGHEFAGIIRTVRDGERYPFRPGDRVVAEPMVGCGICRSCRGGNYNVCHKRIILGVETDGVFAQLVRIPLHSLLKIPDRMPFEEAALVQPVAVTAHALRRTRRVAGGAVAVLGAGPIGALLGMTARAFGAATVVFTEPNPFRRALMERVGFPAIDPTKGDPVAAAISLLGDAEGGFDVVFDAAGAVDTVSQALRMVRFQGEVALIAKYREEPRIGVNEAQKREVNFVTARAHTFEDFRLALKLTANRSIDVRPLITNEIGLDGMAEAFRMLKDRGPMMKVLCQP
jgi:2-desacetyl-2-hydroxyethyl bacteriochlorophyllide A dehydrogenase